MMDRHDALLLSSDAIDILARADAPSVADVQAFSARSFPLPRAEVAAGVATIPVRGMLVAAPSLQAMLFGGFTVYAHLIAAIADAESDPEVSSIVLDIDSPGGHVQGLFEAIGAIERATKPVTARVSRAESAAFVIAAMADRIEARNEATPVGSLGVAVAFRVDNQVVQLTNTSSPDKRPDVTTEQGKAVVRQYLDSVHLLVAEAVARGRGTTVERVNSEFGRGRTMIGREALKVGMIDSIINRVGSSSGSSLSASSADLGDRIVAILKGEAIAEPEPVHAAGDLGDAVVSILRGEGMGSAPAVAVTDDGEDLGDAVVRLMRTGG